MDFLPEAVPRKPLTRREPLFGKKDRRSTGQGDWHQHGRNKRCQPGLTKRMRGDQKWPPRVVPL
jgi:hypothetical protein